MTLIEAKRILDIFAAAIAEAEANGRDHVNLTTQAGMLDDNARADLDAAINAALTNHEQ